jgi:hypothetical protein
MPVIIAYVAGIFIGLWGGWGLRGIVIKFYLLRDNQYRLRNLIVRT